MVVTLVRIFLLSSFLHLSYGQILHSTLRMDSALKSQAALAEPLQKYLRLEQTRLHKLDNLIKQIQPAADSRPMNETELEEKLSKPINALRLVNKLYTETESIRTALQPTEFPEALKSLLDSLPTEDDYKNALRAIARLQDMYQDQADFTRGGAESVLTAREVFKMAETALEDGNNAIALENMKRAKEMFAAEGDPPNSMLSNDHLAILMYKQGNIEYALNYTYELLDYYQHKEIREEVVSRLQKNVKLYREELGWAQDETHTDIPLTKPYENEHEEVYEDYNALCRGEQVQTNGMTNRKLSCHLVDNGNPLLFLAPARVEELSSEAGLSFYHDVLSDNEIKLLRKLAASKFRDSTLAAKEEDKLNYQIRSSNTGWVKDNEDGAILAISRRVSAMTGLDLQFAEPFQVLSYGIGGFYLPHFDYLRTVNPESEQRPEIQPPKRDRIATWIFYLNDVEKGGATVFPNLGATVWPEKGGAAFWYNLYRNGTGNTYTRHAACPVLQGYKWELPELTVYCLSLTQLVLALVLVGAITVLAHLTASNKWFHEGGNEFTRPCGLKEWL